VWFSSDGFAWEPSFTPPADWQVDDLTGGDSGYVMILVRADLDPFKSEASEWEPLVYASSDGRAWEPISESGTFGPGFVGSDSAHSDRHVIVIGNRYTEGRIIEGTVQPKAWIGDLRN
jgi:hypothetical protein